MPTLNDLLKQIIYAKVMGCERSSMQDRICHHLYVRQSLVTLPCGRNASQAEMPSCPVVNLHDVGVVCMHVSTNRAISCVSAREIVSLRTGAVRAPRRP